jgi:hypothetical protein
MVFRERRGLVYSLFSLALISAPSGCQTHPTTESLKLGTGYTWGQVYVLQKDVFLCQYSDTFFDQNVRTWLTLCPPAPSGGFEIAEYVKDPVHYDSHIKGIVRAGTRMEFKYLAPPPRLSLPFMSPANSTDVWLKIIDGSFAGSLVEASDISSEPDNGAWAYVYPDYLVPEHSELNGTNRHP